MSDSSTQSGEESKSQDTSTDTVTKIERPHAQFDQPSEVVADPSLSKAEKAAALATMEQDARQLSTASAEGMGGGEASNLREVLVAEETLEFSPRDAAFASVCQILQGKLPDTEGKPAHAVITRAISALELARIALEELDISRTTPAEETEVAADDELEEEIAKEKLDP